MYQSGRLLKQNFNKHMYILSDLDKQNLRQKKEYSPKWSLDIN